MKKFVAFYMVPIAGMDEMKAMAPEKRDELHKNWKAWQEAHRASFTDKGTPLGKNKRVTKEGVQDQRNEITGYAIVQAESHDEAAKLFQDSPHLEMPAAYVDVLELVEMPGM